MKRIFETRFFTRPTQNEELENEGIVRSLQDMDDQVLLDPFDEEDDGYFSDDHFQLASLESKDLKAERGSSSLFNEKEEEEDVWDYCSQNQLTFPYKAPSESLKKIMTGLDGYEGRVRRNTINYDATFKKKSILSKIPRFSSFSKDKALDEVKEQDFILKQTNIPLAFMEHLNAIAFQLLKQNSILNIEVWKDAILEASLKISHQLKVDFNLNDKLDITNYVKIKKISKSSTDEASLINGVIFTKNLAHKKMASQMYNPTILLISFSLEYAKNDGNELLSLDSIIQNESNFTKSLVDEICRLKPDIVVSQCHVPNSAMQYFLKEGITVLTNVKQKVMIALSRSLRTEIVANMDRLKMLNQIGYCGSFKIQYVPGIQKGFAYFDDIAKPNYCSVILKGEDEDVLKKIKRVLKFMILAVYNSFLEAQIYGEMEISIEPSAEALKIVSDPRIAKVSSHFMNTITNMSCLFKYPAPFAIQKLENFQDSLLMKSLEDFKLPSIQDCQHLTILYSNNCAATKIPCYSAELFFIEFYGKTDLTLQQYLGELESYSSFLCSVKTCDKPLFFHKRRYVHHERAVHVTLKESKRKAQNNSNVLYFSICKVCQYESLAIRLSERSLNYSFGKFLEFLLYNNQLKVGGCEHRACISHSHLFLKKNVEIHFSVDEICLYDISSTSKEYEISKDAIEARHAQKIKLMNDFSSFYDTVKKRVQNIPLDLVGQEKITLIHKELVKLTKMLVNDKNEFNMLIQTKEKESEKWNFMIYNQGWKRLREMSERWDQNFVELEKQFFSTEREKGFFGSMFNWTQRNSHLNTFLALGSTTVGLATMFDLSFDYGLNFSGIDCNDDTMVFPTIGENDEIRAEENDRNLEVLQILQSIVSSSMNDTIHGNILHHPTMLRRISMQNMKEGIRRKSSMKKNEMPASLAPLFGPLLVAEKDQENQSEPFSIFSIDVEDDDMDENVIDGWMKPRLEKEENESIASSRRDSLASSIRNDDSQISSIMKTITNLFTNEPLYPPLSRFEHEHFIGNVIVREEELPTIISCTLDSKQYKEDIEKFNQDPQVIMESGSIVHLKYRTLFIFNLIEFSEGNCKFFCKVFFADKFHSLLQTIKYNEIIIQSLSQCNKWMSGGGKSGSIFFKSSDNMIIVKQVTKYELESFIKFGSSYFEFMSQRLFNCLPSVLAKIYGIYKIGYRNSTTGKSTKMAVVVMENLFYRKDITQIYDLKGSLRNRHANESQVLMDENLMENIYEKPLYVREHSKKFLQASIWNDTLFLFKMNVMDYSLLVGISEEGKEITVGIVDYLRSFTWDKKLESWVKESGLLGGGGREPTIVSPKQYKMRFRESMEKYFLKVPDKWTNMQ